MAQAAGLRPALLRRPSFTRAATHALDDLSLVVSSVVSFSFMRTRAIQTLQRPLFAEYAMRAVLAFASAATLLCRKLYPDHYSVYRTHILISLRALRLAIFVYDVFSLRAVAAAGAAIPSASAFTPLLTSYLPSIVHTICSLLAFSLGVVPFLHSLSALPTLWLDTLSFAAVLVFLVIMMFWPAVEFLSQPHHVRSTQLLCHSLNSAVYIIEELLLVVFRQDRDLASKICDQRPAWPLVLFTQAFFGFCVPMWVALRMHHHLSYLLRMDLRAQAGWVDPRVVQLLPQVDGLDALMLGSCATALWVAAMKLHGIIAQSVALPVRPQ